MELNDEAVMRVRWTGIRQALAMLRALHSAGMDYGQAIERLDDTAVKTLLGNGGSAGELLNTELANIRREFQP